MGDVYKKIDELPFNSVQKAAIQLIQCDLKFLYTIFIRRDYIPPNYYVALMPYMGLIVDGVEDWIKAYNNSSKVKLEAPVFTVPQQAYYEEMRKSIKLYEKGAVYITDGNSENFEIVESKRIGIDYAEEVKDFLWRFYIKDNKLEKMFDLDDIKSKDDIVKNGETIV